MTLARNLNKESFCIKCLLNQHELCQGMVVIKKNVGWQGYNGAKYSGKRVACACLCKQADIVSLKMLTTEGLN